MKVREGDIFWVDEFPPLDGSRPCRHPVVVIDLADDDPVVVVGITTDRTDPGRIDLQSTAEEPGATTGLPEPCCVLPRWIVNLDRTRLLEHEYCGYLLEATLEKLAEAVENILSEWPGEERDARGG